MKMIFVDAENIGLKALEKVKATPLDKVFVFSKVDAIKLACEKSLYLCLSDYPTATNQADFYIIAYLARILSTLDKQQLGSVQFELHSNDESLLTAFEFQCKQLGAGFNCLRTKKSNVVNLPKPEAKSPVDKVLAALKSPKTLGPELQNQLGLSKSDFTRAINELTKSNQIQRSPESKRKWIQC